jgi:thermitase
LPVGARSAAATPAASAAAPFVPGIIVAKRKPSTSADVLARAVVGATSMTTLPLDRVEVLNVRPGQELATVASLSTSGLVEYAEPDYLMHTADITPNDPDFSQQWALPKIEAPTAWQATLGSNRVTVAVIDTGYDLTHPDRPVNLVAGPTYTSGSAPFETPPCPAEGTNGPQDDYGHGTHVGGIVAAAFNNDQGVVGVSPDVTEMVIKAGDCDGNLADTDVALAIQYAQVNGARVINMSFGGSTDSQVIDDAIQGAWSAGLILVAAAGNEHSTAPFYPASTSNVVAVSATDQSDNLASFSNWGADIAVAAPGESILSTIAPDAPINPSPGSDYALLSGTSMAAPHVAAVAALVLSTTCGRSNAQIVSALEQGATQLDPPMPNTQFGYGRIDAVGALKAAGVAIPALPGPTPVGVTPRWIFPLVPLERC